MYNETLRDLLAERKRSDSGALLPSPALPLRETSDGGMVVSGLSVHHPKTAEEVFELLAKGNSHRSQSPTDRNSESSRSHAVLQINIQRNSGVSGADPDSGVGGEVRLGKLSLIDLAGSERAAASNNRGSLMHEGANINRSLLALGNCINALASISRDANHPASDSKTHFVPYRDSKLTRLLKDSLVCGAIHISNR